MGSDFQTVHALRSDVALQVARYAQRLGASQLAVAKQLDVPQPTLSKIVNGRTSDLSLELLLRIAVRAGLRLTLQIGPVPHEAGAFASATQPATGRTFPSRVATRGHALLKESLRELTPAQRLEAFVAHNELASELREAGRAAQGPPMASLER
jgi:predicted XRE-type DNA-binding protein